MVDEPEEEEARHRRGLKFRRRDDFAVELFNEALRHLDVAAHVGRILAQLGRFYNPYLNAAIVDPATRREVLEALDRGDDAAARRLLEERLTQYARPGQTGA
jgi:hypothetical protein